MKTAVIGTGLLGRPLAERLLARQFPVTVYNRTREKAVPLQALGATVADTAREAIESSDCIILMVADAPAIRSVLFDAVPPASFTGRTVIQMGTITPLESIEIGERVTNLGGEYIEVPVLGSIKEAREGQLVLMAGCTPEQFNQWKDFLFNLGPEPLHVGAVGRAAALKLALNQLIASLTAAFSFSLGFVLRENVPVDLFMKILRGSALHAPTFDKKLQRMMDRDFSNPNFPVKHLLKDVDLILREARTLDLETSGIQGVLRILEIALDQGHGEDDYSALYNAVNPE